MTRPPVALTGEATWATTTSAAAARQVAGACRCTPCTCPTGASTPTRTRSPRRAAGPWSRRGRRGSPTRTPRQSSSSSPASSSPTPSGTARGRSTSPSSAAAPPCGSR
ncbi:hypothetical protein N866_04580 [Actinotalea ferrariae CF5-4]|uniref:Uncharacterized protein n=1 Tax=Actinotalea ferrariae CF5-4 TaxID=948458 RepID=A0A021VS77_9CELL|nr:hypothetical protein N866_04580 [Actinotalea ferrariae CF5-4]